MFRSYAAAACQAAGTALAGPVVMVYPRWLKRIQRA
jgi:hypothetical protein